MTSRPSRWLALGTVDSPLVALKVEGNGSQCLPSARHHSISPQLPCKSWSRSRPHEIPPVVNSISVSSQVPFNPIRSYFVYRSLITLTSIPSGGTLLSKVESCLTPHNCSGIKSRASATYPSRLLGIKSKEGAARPPGCPFLISPLLASLPVIKKLTHGKPRIQELGFASPAEKPPPRSISIRPARASKGVSFFALPADTTAYLLAIPTPHLIAKCPYAR